MDAEDNLANLRVASFSYYLKPTDQENFVHKIGGPLEEPIPGNILEETSFPISSGRTKSSVIKPSYAINFSHSLDSKDHLPSHRLDALPPHLYDAQENFVFKAKGSVQDPKAALVSPPKYPTHHVERTKSTNGEIDIFGADKYFNMKLDYGTRMKHEDKNEDQVVDLPGLKLNLRSGIPSVNSEASSWNSRSALLQNVPRNTSQTKPRKALTSRIFASFGCTSPCLDKQAVYINEKRKAHHGIECGIKLSQPAPKSGDHFAFPILNSETQTLTVQKPLEDAKAEEARKSLEVFGSYTMRKGDIPVNLERKLSMLTWDAIPKASSLPTTTVGSTTICDDMASDASSDLFEIENISGAGYPILTMQEAGDVSPGCMTPTTQYAPSEASIAWSVVTASAADFSSVISDYDEKNIGIAGDINLTDAKNSRSKNGLIKETQKTRPSGLLGCKSQKAVIVVETAHKTRVERY